MIVVCLDTIGALVRTLCALVDQQVTSRMQSQDHSL